MTSEKEMVDSMATRISDLEAAVRAAIMMMGEKDDIESSALVRTLLSQTTHYVRMSEEIISSVKDKDCQGPGPLNEEKWPTPDFSKITGKHLYSAERLHFFLTKFRDYVADAADSRSRGSSTLSELSFGIRTISIAKFLSPFGIVVE